MMVTNQVAKLAQELAEQLVGEKYWDAVDALHLARTILQAKKIQRIAVEPESQQHRTV